MSKLPVVKPDKLIRFIEHLGFSFSRQKGSHMFFKHSDGRTTTIRTIKEKIFPEV